MKARKKPVVVDCWRFDRKQAESNFAYDYPMVNDMALLTSVENALERKHRFYIDTLEGQMTVSDGDYIIKGVNGEFYPCKPDIFHKTYEIIE